MSCSTAVNGPLASRWATIAAAVAATVWPLLVIAAVGVPLALATSGALGIGQLGDEVATGVGLGVQRHRLLVIGLAVVLTAAAVAAAGPVGFVAFVAGPIAKRLTRGSGPSLVPAALVGAVVVVLSDVAGQHLLPVELPVGVVTAAVGAPYLLWLLVRSNRAGVGG